MKIIDRTLTTLDSILPNGKLLINLCEKLAECGVDFIEISVPVLLAIGIDNLPKNVNYILHIHSLDEHYAFPQLTRFSCSCCTEENYNQMITQFQVNDIREIQKLRNFQSKNINARIIGLDDIIMHDYRYYFKILQNIFGNNLDICPQNKYGCATAIAVEWAISGGKSVSASYSGIGGFAPLEEVIVALRIKTRRKPNKNLKTLCEIKDIYTKITHSVIPRNKPVLGEGIFVVEAGIHTDGISKNPLTYEPYDPTIIGENRSIVIGKHSGTKSIQMKLAENNIPTSKKEIPSLLKAVQKEITQLGRSLKDEEFLQLYMEVKAHEKEKISD